MKSVTIELPDKIVQELETMVKRGWSNNEAEIVRQSIMEYIRRHPLGLLERFQREDIGWALRQKVAPE